MGFNGACVLSGLKNEQTTIQDTETYLNNCGNSLKSKRKNFVKIITYL